MDLRQIFATNLRRLRHAKGLSQEVLALEAGVNRTYVSKIEKGHSYVGLEIIEKLAGTLEVQPFELLLSSGRGSKAGQGQRRKKAST